MKLTVISEADFLESIASALQFISYYHPADYIRALASAYETEESPAAKNAIGQILVNSRMAALGRRPMCQDTGAVSVFLKIGQRVIFDTERPISDLVDEAVRRAYRDGTNPLRASIVSDPLGERRNTGDNTPAVVSVEMVPGSRLQVAVVAKGGGSDNKARFTTLNPHASVPDWIVTTLKDLGAGWCPPGILGIGVGGSPDKAMLMAKQALLQPIDMGRLLARGPQTPEERLRVEVFERVNDLGIGAQGLGGLTTVVDVKVKSFATHAASMPVALIPQCAAVRHVEFELDGAGPAHLEPPNLADWPELSGEVALQATRRVDLDKLTSSDIATWRAGETLLLSGRLLTARDAAHRRLAEQHAGGIAPPVDFEDRALYYVGPVEAVGDEVIGPAGPTTSTRMDEYSELMLGEFGLSVMIGKAERGKQAVDSIRRHGAAYLIAVGGAAVLIAQAVKRARKVAFQDLGMEAIHEFEVKDMPVMVAVDSTGTSIHEQGPQMWREQIRARRAVVTKP